MSGCKLIKVLPVPVENIRGEIRWLNGKEKVVVIGKSELKPNNILYFHVTTIEYKEMVYPIGLESARCCLLWKHPRK